ncbi:MAG: hypothetical protein V5B44_12315 [Candidatus Accumulibacter necessarius]|jgi:hypothetical protein|uniref:hypothetical protein n=1 Tax=Candidatus Accumulibacter necessarius TaxID=2954386 RepID=UPI002FC2E3C9
MILLALASSFQDAHPFAHLGYLAWPLAFAAHFFLLYRHEAPGKRHLAWLHAAGCGCWRRWGRGRWPGRSTTGWPGGRRGR